MTDSIVEIFNVPIVAQYPASDIATIANEAESCVITATDNMLTVNTYYHDKLSGTKPQMFTRMAVLRRLHDIAARLKPNFGLMLFDTFRTIETQAHLYQLFYDEIQLNHPDWDHSKLTHETRRYVTDPSDRGRFAIAPHNSGGAVDLAIYSLHSKQMLNFGSAFDELSEHSRTDFFEQDYQQASGFTAEVWYEIQKNRRLLFNLMKQAGFVNYHEEWWHYGLGDCMWAAILHGDWIFDSMESEVCQLS